MGDAWCKSEELEHPDTRAEHRDNPEHKVGEGDDEEDEEPKPEEDVDLVIDHVYR